MNLLNSKEFDHKTRSKTNATTETQLNLIRLTTFASHRPKTRKKRSRKISHFPRDVSGPRWLLNWLHSLRLHKYASYLRGLSPSALLELDEDELIERGIGSIRARMKLIVVY